MKFVDTHAHLLDGRLACRADDIVANLESDNLEFVVEISASVDESPCALRFAQAHDNVYCTLGVHPHVCDKYNDEYERWVIANATDPKVVAIGECGLDYHYMKHPKELQRDVFIRQILLADKVELPLVVHSRDALDDTIEILTAHKRHLRNGVLMHCFSYDAEAVRRLLAVTPDTYFAFGGAVTYKGNLHCDKAISAVPLDRLLLETDSPYLSPVPLRGKINEPKNVAYVAAHIANVLNVNIKEVAQMTTSNAKRFYKL